jgi:hypothetical protein
MGRFLLVTLEEDLARYGTTHNAAFLSVQHVNGVHDVVDLRAISAATLVSFLGVDRDVRTLLEQRAADTSPDHVIRAYWKRVRQPGLPLDWAT